MSLKRVWQEMPGNIEQYGEAPSVNVFQGPVIMSSCTGSLDWRAYKQWEIHDHDAGWSGQTPGTAGDTFQLCGRQL